MTQVVAAVVTEEHQVPQLGWRALDSLLKYWGNARWRVGLCGGFASESPTAACIQIYEPRDWFQVGQLTASGRQRPHYGGHRVLYDQAWGVSKTLVMVNMAVCALPEAQFQAVVVSYAIGYTCARDFSQKERADLLDITPDALQERLRRARKKLGQMLARATERDVNSSQRRNYV